MMYLHYCRTCSHLHMLNGHKHLCPGCLGNLTELKLNYLTYVEMNESERQALMEKLRTEEGLINMSTTYRMLKYSKWYKEQNIKLL